MNDHDTRHADFWRGEAERQRERAAVLEREVERQRRLLEALLDYFKAQVREATTDGAEHGEVKG